MKKEERKEKKKKRVPMRKQKDSSLVRSQQRRQKYVFKYVSIERRSPTFFPPRLESRWAFSRTESYRWSARVSRADRLIAALLICKLMSFSRHLPSSSGSPDV